MAAAVFQSLPNEILHYICDLLNTLDKLSLSCVCQRLRKILSSPSLNRKASFKNCWHTPCKMAYLYLNKNKEWLLHLDIQNCYWLKQAELIRCLQKCTNLVSLDVSGCTVSQKNVLVLMEKCNKLKHFGWSIDKKTFEDVGRLQHAENPKVPPQVAKLNLCFHKLSSLKLVFYQEKGDSSIGSPLTTLHLKLCEFLLSNLCLKCLELELFTIGYYLCYPLHVAMQMLDDCNIRSLQQRDADPNTFYMWDLHRLIPQYFPLNCSTTVILGYSVTCQETSFIYWRTAVELNLIDEALQLRNLDISGALRVVTGSDLYRLLGCRTLEFINAGITCTSDELSAICSPVLESINLKDSLLSLDSDLSALESLLEKCPRLKHINLLNTHKSWYCSCDRSNDFIKILSKCRTLVSLAVNPCCIRTSEENTPECQTHSRDSRSFTLGTLVDSCIHLAEFELIDSHFESDLRKVDQLPTPLRKPCATNRIITFSSETLTYISQWKHLQKLTLAGFQINGGDFYIAVCKQCTELKYLSIAHLKGPSLSHSGNIACLNRALAHCHNLRDLRLEQPYFDITKAFLNALHNAKKLERVCLMVNHGKLATEEIEPWLNKCTKVVFVQIFCDVSLTMCRTLNKHLESKYGPHRPGFNIGFYAFNCETRRSRLPMLGEQSPRKNTPLIHLVEMTNFASRVASSYKLR